MIKNSYKILIGLAVLIVSFLFLGFSNSVFAGNCVAVVDFDINPRSSPFNQNVTLSGSVTLSGFTPGETGGFCTKNGEQVRGLRINFISFLFDGVSDRSARPIVIPGITIPVRPLNSGPYEFSTTFKPSDKNGVNGGRFTSRVDVLREGGGLLAILTTSSTVPVNLTAGIFGTFACTGPNTRGETVYICSQRSDCGDTSGCTNRASCAVLTDNSKCGNPVTAGTHKACVNNACTPVQGPGSDTCTTSPDSCASGPGGGGPPSTFNFSLQPPTGIETFQDLVNVIGRWVFRLAIPIAVIMIIWAGVLMLTSGGKPEQFGKGTQTLKWAVVGLVVVLIGKGFVSLIKSILDLRN